MKDGEVSVFFPDRERRSTLISFFLRGPINKAYKSCYPRTLIILRKGNTDKISVVLQYTFLSDIKILKSITRVRTLQVRLFLLQKTFSYISINIKNIQYFLFVRNLLFLEIGSESESRHPFVVQSLKVKIWNFRRREEQTRCGLGLTCTSGKEVVRRQ